MPLTVAAAFVSSFLTAQTTPPQNFYVSTARAPEEVATTTFEMGRDERLTVSSTPFPRAKAVRLEPGETLVFVEGALGAIPARHIAGNGTHALLAVGSQTLRNLHSRNDIWMRTIEPHTPRPQSLFPLPKEFSTLKLGGAEALYVDRTRLMGHLETLAGQKPAVLAGREVTLVDRASPENRQATQEWLAQHFERLGFQVNRQCYTSGRNRGCNIEAIQWGSDRGQSIVLGGHFDSVTRGGADDDGTGTAAVMEIAELLSTRALQKTVRYVMFDQEEKGLVGSAAYVETLSPSAEAYPVAAITVDMLGYDGDNDGKIHIIDCDRADSKPLRGLMLEAIARAGSGLTRSDACTNRSDHASFWNKRIPAIIVSENFFGQDGNPCYHRTCDTLDKINTDYFFRISDSLATLTWGLTAQP